MDALAVLNETSVWPLIAHIFGACFCMGCSALFHLVHSKSSATSSVFARLDYGGISILIYGSTFPICFYGFACENVKAMSYVFLGIMGVACLACFIVTLAPRFDQPKYRKWRGIMFIILGLSTALLFVMQSFYETEVVGTNVWLWMLGGYIYI